MAFYKTMTCSNCGKKWDVFKVSVAMRDKDSIECDCGDTLQSWNGGVMFTATPAKEGE